MHPTGTGHCHHPCLRGGLSFKRCSLLRPQRFEAGTRAVPSSFWRSFRSRTLRIIRGPLATPHADSPIPFIIRILRSRRGCNYSINVIFSFYIAHVQWSRYGHQSSIEKGLFIRQHEIYRLRYHGDHVSFSFSLFLSRVTLIVCSIVSLTALSAVALSLLRLLLQGGWQDGRPRQGGRSSQERHRCLRLKWVQYSERVLFQQTVWSNRSAPYVSSWLTPKGAQYRI